MKITLLKKSNSQGIRKANFSEWQVMLIALTILSLPFVGGWVGYEMAKPTADSILTEVALENMRVEISEQQSELEESRKQAQMQLKALTRKIGLMQAELNRINALGQRVAELAKVNKGEFDFSQPPGIGGPLTASANGTNYTANDLFRSLDDFDANIADRSYQLEVLESVLLNKELSAEVRISGRPITKGWISSFYGTRNDPFTGDPAWHGGMDFAGKEGADVIATGSGVVTYSARRNSFGLLVEINHGEGFVTRYAHNNELLVNVGDVVSKGQVIAKMGSEGRSTGPHVHYEIMRYGKSIDPKKYVHRR